MTTRTLEQRFDALEKKHNTLVLQVQKIVLAGGNNRIPRTKVDARGVINLRNNTGVGLIACKDALERCRGDKKLAEEYLLKHCKGYK